MSAHRIPFVLAALFWSGCGAAASGSDMGPSSCPATDTTGCGGCWTRLSQTTLTVSESRIDFGRQAVGSSTDHTVTVTNAGDVASGVVSGNVWDSPFWFKGATSTGNGANYPGTGGTCNTALEPGQSCTIVLSFRPQGDPGMTFGSIVTLQWVRGFQCDNGGGGGPQPPTVQISLSGSD